jgi:hypothetical protein
MVEINPLPLWCRKIPRRLWPGFPPPFPDGTPTPDDIEEARELYLALDPQSQWWYRSLRPRLGLPELSDEQWARLAPERIES